MVFALFDLVLHIDSYLEQMAIDYGLYIYVILFIIIFCETGLLVTPFLPGDSLLFISGALAGSGVLHIWTLLFVIITAAIIGDTANYWIGKYAGCRLMEGRMSAFIHIEWLEKTHHYFEKYGGITIIIARFIPIVRTFAPFLAGVGKMHYRWFLFYNVFGAVIWTVTFVGGGYLVGNVPKVQEHVSLLMWLVLAIFLFSIGMVLKSVISAIFLKKKKEAGEGAAEVCYRIQAEKE